MNRAKRFLAEAAEKLELPVDILAGVPKMELTGFREFSMEPHQGLVTYEKNRISVKSDLGRVLILGEGLCIRLMNRQRITICGDLAAVELERQQYA